MGISPSYAWRSILSSKDIIMIGSRWSIRDGSKLKIWNDNWIPNNSGFNVLGMAKGLSRDALVKDLIDQDLTYWRRNILERCFDPFEAMNIASIPLSRNWLEDKLIWHKENDGNHTIKFAYHMLGAKRASLKEGPSRSLNALFWKKIWKSLVHARIRKFLWRVDKNILPIKTNLEKRY